MHQAYRQRGMADGNEATPMVVDALAKGKEKGKGKEKSRGKGKEKGKEKGRAKSKDKPKEGTPDKSSNKCFFCKAMPEKIAPSSRAGSLRKRQWVTRRVRTPSRKRDGSSPLNRARTQMRTRAILPSMSMTSCAS